MKKLKDLVVKVTYSVHLLDVEIPDAALVELKNMETDTHDGLGHEDDFLDAFLKKNIKERDCIHLEYEIEYEQD